jgi:colicin import membrane protein
MSNALFSLVTIEEIEGPNKRAIKAKTAFTSENSEELLEAGHAEVYNEEFHGHLEVNAGVELKPMPARFELDALPAGASQMQKAALEKYNEQVRAEAADKAAADKAAADKAAADKAAADKAAADKAAADKAAAEI